MIYESVYYAFARFLLYINEARWLNFSFEGNLDDFVISFGHFKDYELIVLACMFLRGYVAEMTSIGLKLSPRTARAVFTFP